MLQVFWSSKIGKLRKYKHSKISLASLSFNVHKRKENNELIVTLFAAVTVKVELVAVGN